MLKKIFSLFVVFVVVAMALCACEATTPPDHNDQSSSSQTGDTRESIEETSESTTAPDTSNPPSGDNVTFSDWSTAYLDFVERREREYGKESAYGFEFSYALVYIDNDDIPELYALGICEADGDTVCTFRNGRVVEERLERRFGGKYVERSGILVNQNGHMGRYYDNVYQLDQNGFSQILDAVYTKRYVELENGDFDTISEYFIDGKTVSKDEYYDAVNQAVDLSKAVEFYENAVPYAEIKQQIAGDK